MYRNYFSILLFALLLASATLSVFFKTINPPFFLLTVIVSSLCFYLFRRRAKRSFQKYKIAQEELQEQLNLLKEEVKKKNNILKELPSRVEQISSIKDIIQKFTDLIDREQLCKSIVENTGRIFPEADNVLLFLFQREKDSLALQTSVRKHQEVVKEKKGDILDWWVLKNNQCLVVDDITSDYRFDFAKVQAFKQRQAHAFMSSPLCIGNRIFAIMRLESKTPGVFHLEDSRVMRILCDLAAVVLERANLFERIRELAIRDPLTNLFLRNYFLERFEEEIQRTSSKKTKFGLVILDVDNFKKINDTYGHVVGDMVLRRLSSLLNRIIGNAGNVICRMGGEEFVFLIVESDKAEVRRIADRIRKGAADCTVRFRRQEIHFTLSMGLVMYPEDGVDTQQLFVAVDKLLYQAKQKGKNRLCFM